MRKGWLKTSHRRRLLTAPARKRQREKLKRPRSDLPIPPGDTVSETMEELRISRKKLSTESGVSLEMLGEIIDGGSAVSGSEAAAIAGILGIPSYILSRLSEDYLEARRRLGRRGT